MRTAAVGWPFVGVPLLWVLPKKNDRDRARRMGDFVALAAAAL